MEKSIHIKTDNESLRREIGLVAATSIVVGNVIGSGIFMAPQSLASASNPKATILAWVITGIGSILVALSFAKLSSSIPESGGAIIYAKAAFGDFAAFIIAWTYWIAGWVGNAAIITACLSYLVYFIPALNGNRLFAFLLSSFILWILTLINIKGAKETGIVEIITTVSKLIPIVIFIIIASTKFNPNYFNTVSDVKLSDTMSLPPAISITLWAFIGLEGAAVAGGNIKNPEKNIPRSTIIGIIFATIIYIFVSVFAIGAIDQAALAKSSAPLADIINITTGTHWGGALIAAGAVVSTIGAALGWQLVVSRGAMAAGKGKLFPSIFAKINARTGTPIISLVIDSILVNIALIFNYVGSLQGAYNFLILLSTLAVLPSYSICAAAEIVLIKKKLKAFNPLIFIKSSFIPLITFLYTVYAIYGTGPRVVMYGFLLMLVGIPFYVYIKLQNSFEADSLT